MNTASKIGTGRKVQVIYGKMGVVEKHLIDQGQLRLAFESGNAVRYFENLAHHCRLSIMPGTAVLAASYAGIASLIRERGW